MGRAGGVGRCLVTDDNDAAIGIFSHTDARLPAAHPIRHNVLASKGYALNRLGRFADAVSALDRWAKHAGLRRVRIWHLLARAYAPFRLWKETGGDRHKSAFESDVADAKKQRWYRAEAAPYTERDAKFRKYL